MRKVRFAPGECYHIFNRGNAKTAIFRTNSDYVRLLFLILFFQAPLPIYNINRYTRHYVKHRVFNISEGVKKEIVEKRLVELLAFTFVPNHFHLILQESVPSGISRYMQRILDAYTKYFNTKYGQNGHLFQGPFQAVHVETNEQLLYLSAYVHRNQRELSQWRGREHLYPWSSYTDYLDTNRWGELLDTQKILGQFSDSVGLKKHKPEKDYREFVEQSKAKEKEQF